MFISQAVAQTTDAAGQIAVSGMPDGMKVIIQFALIFIVLYFLLIRPQQKRVKEHELELSRIQKGDQILVNGIIGEVVDLKDEQKFLIVEIAKDVRITVLRASVSQILSEDKNKK